MPRRIPARRWPCWLARRCLVYLSHLPPSRLDSLLNASPTSFLSYFLNPASSRQSTRTWVTVSCAPQTHWSSSRNPKVLAWVDNQLWPVRSWVNRYARPLDSFPYKTYTSDLETRRNLKELFYAYPNPDMSGLLAPPQHFMASIHLSNWCSGWQSVHGAWSSLSLRAVDSSTNHPTWLDKIDVL